MHGPPKTHPDSTWMLAGCGVCLIALGPCFGVLRPRLLAEDPRFIVTTLAQIGAAYVASP